jgi:hypothetical protein
MSEGKSEARNSKSETNSNDQTNKEDTRHKTKDPTLKQEDLGA